MICRENNTDKDKCKKQTKDPYFFLYINKPRKLRRTLMKIYDIMIYRGFFKRYTNNYCFSAILYSWKEMDGIAGIILFVSVV